jgi:hypothetical protein
MFKNNPIFFKDLLISLNSKQWKIIIFFFIIIYFIAFLLFLSEIKSDYNFYDTSSIWRNLFITAWITQLLVLTWISFFKWLQNFTTEKSQKTIDFIKISPITSTQFILWKFLANISFVLLLFIISLPFLSISLVLWWVNLSDILIYCLFTFSYTSFFVLLGMFLSSISKNIIFSILYWFLVIPALIFYIVFFLWITTDYFEFSNTFPSWTENIIFSIIPVTIFDYISNLDKLIDFFWLKIHYLFFHISFFWIINYFLFTYLKKQYLKFSNLKVKTFSYFETSLLVLLFFIFSGVFSSVIFWLVFSALIFIYIFYISNNQKIWFYKYIYFIIIFILSSIIITIFHWLLLNTILILFLIFLLLFTFSDFLKSFFSEISSWIFNIIYLLLLILFFYVIPLISTNLLNIKIKTFDSVVKTALYNDDILEFNCNSISNFHIKNEYSWNSWKCRWITDTNLYFYYFLYLFLNILFVSTVIIFNRKK